MKEDGRSWLIDTDSGKTENGINLEVITNRVNFDDLAMGVYLIQIS